MGDIAYAPAPATPAVVGRVYSAALEALLASTIQTRQVELINEGRRQLRESIAMALEEAASPGARIALVLLAVGEFCGQGQWLVVTPASAQALYDTLHNTLSGQ